MNRPETGSSLTLPSVVSVNVTPDSDFSPWMSETAEFQAKLILGSFSARSAMILLARSLSRRCTMVTDWRTG